VIDAIQLAKGDSRIKMIVLQLGNLAPSGLSKLQEIGAALREFRAAGKRVVAAGRLDGSDAVLPLAAQAGEVYLDRSAWSMSTASELLPHVLEGRH